MTDHRKTRTALIAEGIAHLPLEVRRLPWFRQALRRHVEHGTPPDLAAQRLGLMARGRLALTRSAPEAP